ncbi:putative ABC transport system permease protein [Gracilibacillus halotolerans]|uniref:Putative ABC transport system permease protein n=1 Tax=Gracilibacillus halotolerans TaxID=74386 RepID=A0A841RMI4_9BACI|nr:ABC transporter permease [Gracilibacillus halotolerans]MBB6512365.1 putative ABC transport system permease protein [Gracilibacillus halotolerans]
MSIFENIKMALSSIFTHKLRSSLTIIGIIIGVGSVIAVVAVGKSGEAMLKSQFVGEKNTIELYYNPSEEELQANPNSLLEASFTFQDIRTIENISEVQRIVASSSERTKVSYKGKSTNGLITGVSDIYMEVNQLKVSSGRMLLSRDFFAGNRTAVVSESFRDELFDNDEMMGKIIYIESQPVEIVGVLKEEKNIFAFDSNAIYLPLKTWQSIFSSTAISEISIQAETPENLRLAGEKATNILNRIHNKEDAYQVMNMEEIADGVAKVTNIMTIIIGSIAGISLFVGGIGVMNIMLVSVTERTREIGIRMSLGATREQILTQFLIESIVLTLFGGLIGILFGTGGAMIFSYVAGWPSLISLPVIIGGILFSMLIGTIFGIMPARKAARMDPIQALGYG